MEEKYFVNEEKRTVVCVIKKDDKSFSGVARCSINDTFNEYTGRKIAYAKAFVKVCRHDSRFREAIYDYYKLAYDQAKNLLIEAIRNADIAAACLETAKDDLADILSQC